jgi:hypothetical protein
MIPHLDIESQMMVSEEATQISVQSSYMRDRRFASLMKLAEPVGVLSKYRYSMQISGVNLALSGGRLIVKHWSHSGRGNHTTLRQSEGQQFSLIVAMPNITTRCLKVSVTGFRPRSCDLSLNFRWTVRYHRTLAYDHPYFVAIEKGDLGYLQNQLSSRKLCLSDCIAGGYSLLHVSITYGEIRARTDSGRHSMQYVTIGLPSLRC